MSDAQPTVTAPLEVTPEAPVPATTTAAAETTEAPAAEPVAATEVPTTETETAAAAEEPTTDAAAPAEESKTEAAVPEKAVEPISEGQLAYKGPGLVKSLIPSKKEFWLDDAAVTPANMDLFMRGEKPDISHPIVAWASQTGRGLLFFNKKGDTERSHPGDALALYDATDLKKEYPHTFAFKVNGHSHSFKAANDAERDGWYLSIEKAIELGKASTEEIRGSEGYKAEIEKLNKPASTPKKSAEVEGAAAVAAEQGDKKQKSRSTSRGMLNRFKAKKDEVEQKAADKKEEKKEEKEEAAAEEKKPEEESKETEAAEVAAPAAAVAGVAAAEAPSTEEPATETTPETTTDAAEEKPKPSKRGSIFGKMQSGWSSIKSPSKEKSEKDAELKPEVPAKDTAVAENPPQLPETATADEPALETAIPAVEEPAAEEKVEPTKEAATETTSPGKEKKSFLSGLGGLIKRDRSVSPSTVMKEPAKKDEETAATPAVTEETAAAAPPTEEAAPEVPAAETAPADEPASTETAEKSAEEAKADEATPKRQSVFTTLGRRASKAFRGIQSPKKENATPAAATETPEVEEEPVVNGETKAPEAEAPTSIGDVVPEAVTVGQAQTTAPVVAASA